MQNKWTPKPLIAYLPLGICAAFAYAGASSIAYWLWMASVRRSLAGEEGWLVFGVAIEIALAVKYLLARNR